MTAVIRQFPKSILYLLIQYRIRVWLDIIKLLVSMRDVRSRD